MEIKEFETKVIDIIRRTHDIKSFRFAVPEEITFKPGQFLVLTIKVKDQEATKHFSFSNSPTEKGYVEFTKRITDSEFSQAIDKLKVGDWARLKMPYGFFTFEGEYSKIACLSGGIGITAIRSICKFVNDERLPTNIILIYSNKTENDIAFHEDLAQMESENEKMRVIYTLSEPVDKIAWKGKIGFIDSAMVREEITDYAERVFYICGPPKMVDYLRSLLSEELKLDKKSVKWEHFLGYD
jgi:ferredoxin-NADP reductase